MSCVRWGGPCFVQYRLFPCNDIRFGSHGALRPEAVAASDNSRRILTGCILMKGLSGGTLTQRHRMW